VGGVRAELVESERFHQAGQCMTHYRFAVVWQEAHAIASEVGK
jgi:hypothetical protein